ncbi:hypothetical protein GIB67_001663, partial [Kingdonia uniflora]
MKRPLISFALTDKMINFCAVIASFILASAMALAPSSMYRRDVGSDRCSNQEFLGKDMGLHGATWKSEQFSPRFDCLRFIEILVTAH